MSKIVNIIFQIINIVMGVFVILIGLMSLGFGSHFNVGIVSVVVQ